MHSTEEKSSLYIQRQDNNKEITTSLHPLQPSSTTSMMIKDQCFQRLTNSSRSWRNHLSYLQWCPIRMMIVVLYFYRALRRGSLCGRPLRGRETRRPNASTVATNHQKWAMRSSKMGQKVTQMQQYIPLD